MAVSIPRCLRRSFDLLKEKAMNRRSMLAVTAAVLSGAGSVSAVGVASAQQSPEIDQVREASTALYASLSSLDLGPVERFWAHDSYVRYIGPTNKAVDGYASCERNAEVRFVKSELAASFEVLWARKSGRAKKRRRRRSPLSKRPKSRSGGERVAPPASCYV